MMKKLVFLLTTLFLVLLLAACGDNDSEAASEEAADGSAESVAANDAQYTIRASIGLNSDHPQYKGLLKFKEIVEEETNGAIAVETYHSGQLGDDRTAMEALQLGSQEVTIPSTSPVANFISEFAIFDIPFLFPNAQVADSVLDGEIGTKLLEMLEEQNLVGLAYWENGFRDMSNNTRPIESAADFKGLKIRTMENDLHLAVFRELGANPTPMAMPEVFTALQQGSVDGQENPLSTIYIEGLYEVQEYVSSTNHIYTPFVFLVSKSFYDSLPEDFQEIVRSAAVESGQYQREINREATEGFKQSLIDEGVEFTEVSEEAKAEMREAVLPVVEEYADTIGKDLVEEMYQAVEDAQ